VLVVLTFRASINNNNVDYERVVDGDDEISEIALVRNLTILGQLTVLVRNIRHQESGYMIYSYLNKSKSNEESINEDTE
jgi:hypothetical protein